MELGISPSVKVLFLSWIWYGVLFGFRSDRSNSTTNVKLAPAVQSPSSFRQPWRSSLDIPEGELLGCESSTAEGVKKGRKTCRFRNLCTSSHFNIFFVNRGPKVRWRDHSSGEPAVNVRYDVTPISAVESGVKYLTYAEVAEEYMDIEEHKYVIHSRGKHVLLRHLTSDNIAHDIHDIILPFFHTVGPSEIENGPRYKDVKVRIQGGLGYSSELYRLFFEDFLTDSTRQLAQSGKGIICYEDMLVGLSRDTVWYHYGTTRTQPGPIRDTNMTSEHIRNFTVFVQKRFDIDGSCPMNAGYGVLFVRSRDRRILNREELMEAIERNYGVNMVELDLDEHTLRDVIKTISCAKFVVGMHGSMMILGMFLPRDSVLIEMFPYAINPDHFTQYRAMLSIPGMDIDYITWRNVNRTASILVTDEHLNVLLQSVSGIDRVSREKILNRTEVPPKYCCNDPEVRYRLYHDTIVDIPAVIDSLRDTSLGRKMNLT